MRTITRLGLALGLVLGLALAAPASAQTPRVGPGAVPPKYQNLGGNIAGPSGNGADTTEDVLPTCSFTMPIGAMPNVGDIWQVTLGGKYISSTDNKSARVRAGTTSTGVPIMLSAVATALNQTSWAAIIKFMKIGFNAQNVWVMSTIGSSSNAFSGTNVSTGAFQETLVNNFVVTGQNATNPVASSVTCQYMQIEYFAVSQ